MAAVILGEASNAMNHPVPRECYEVADLVTYLASSESSFLTGVSVDINGGLYFS